MIFCESCNLTIPFEPQVQHNAGSRSTGKFSVDLVCIQVQHAALFALPVVHNQHRIFNFNSSLFKHYAKKFLPENFSERQQIERKVQSRRRLRTFSQASEQTEQRHIPSF